MSYTITRYVFPLESKIELSYNNKFYLDNPRTVKEKATIKNYIEKSLVDYDSHQNQIASLGTRIAFGLQRLIAYCTCTRRLAGKWIKNEERIHGLNG